MNFKRNILGLAVIAAVASYSLPAISADLNAPDALDGVQAEAPVITTAGFTGEATYNNMATALTNVSNAIDPAADAASLFAGNATDIAAAQAAIVAANALTAGQLIGGQTSAEIITAQNSSLTTLNAATAAVLESSRRCTAAAALSAVAAAALQRCCSWLEHSQQLPLL